MKILIDMNLSAGWVETFEQQGWEAAHWRNIGDPREEDSVIMQWARTYGYIVFTHDLDFGTLLALTKAEGPSVIQIRTQDVMPASLGKKMVQIIHRYESQLEELEFRQIRRVILDTLL
jgi:predicted nuclease of predicted toxin-antitoxin system